MQPVEYFILLLASLPILTALTLLLWRKEAAVVWADRAGAFAKVKRDAVAAKDSGVKSWSFRAVLWPFAYVHDRSAPIQDAFQRAAVRALGHGYLAIALLSVFGFLAYFAVMLVIGLLMIVAGLWIFAKVVGGNDSDDGRASAKSYRETSGTSHDRQDIFGERYVEHLDESGHSIGESRTRTGLMGGRYVEDTDDQGYVVGESEQRRDILGGTYAAHVNAAGHTAGESWGVEGIFGDRRLEHQDADGNLVGRSTPETSWLGERRTRRTGRGDV